MIIFAAQISKQYTQYGAALLFFVFGFKMLYEVITAVEKVNHCMLSVLCMPLSAGLPCTYMHTCTTYLHACTTYMHTCTAFLLACTTTLCNEHAYTGCRYSWPQGHVMSVVLGIFPNCIFFLLLHCPLPLDYFFHLTRQGVIAVWLHGFNVALRT